MTPRRFWMLVTFAGIAMVIGGIIATVLLTIETGTRQPDYACNSNSMQAALRAVCYTSNDPKVLLGVAPLLVGIGVIIFGAIKWSSARQYESALPPPPPAPSQGGNLLDSLERMREQAKAADARAAADAATAPPTLPPQPPSS